MSTLRDMIEFSDFRREVKEFAVNCTHQPSTNNMDLNKFHSALIKAKKLKQYIANDNKDEINPTTLLYDIFSLELLRSFKKDLTPVLNKYIGFSNKYNSLTISVFNENDDIQTIAIKKAFDRNKETVKWKSYGKKSLITSKIKDDFVFLAVGMKELVLLELMDISYVHIQSDSMYKNISQDLINRCRNLIILKENDKSFESLISKLQEIFLDTNIFIIDFKKLKNNDLPKGYDFVDYCNDIGDIAVVEEELEEELIRQTKERK